MSENPEQKEPTHDNVETSIIPSTILAKLREPFPKETHESKLMDDGFIQTGVKPAYIIERLNQVLGIEGWDAEELEIKEKDNFVATKVKLNIYLIYKAGETITKILIASRTQWGSAKINPRGEYGDTLKSAYTNALCKCASMIDVAHEAYKGLLPPVQKTNDLIDPEEAKQYDAKKVSTKKSKGKTDILTASNNAQIDAEATPIIKAKRKELLSLFTGKGLTRNDLQKLMMDNFNKNESRELTESEVIKLVELVKAMPDESHSQNGENNSGENSA